MKARRPLHQEQEIGSTQSSLSSDSCLDSPLPNQRSFYCSQSLTASATGTDGLDTSENTSEKPSVKQLEQEFHDNHTEYKQYIVEYRYEGSSWGLEIWATSFEDAEARVRQLSSSKVLGELKASIPVPEKPFNWIKRLVRTWL